MKIVNMEWKPVTGFEGLYEVSDCGEVRSLSHEAQSGRGSYIKVGRVLKQTTRPKGYKAVNLWRDGRTSAHLVHRLVAAAFYGPSPLQVRHKNGNPADNVVSNLLYGTNAQNQQDSVRHRTHHMSRKTHCKNDHPFDDANTYHYTTVRGGPGRSCRKCHADRQRGYNRR